MPRFLTLGICFLALLTCSTPPTKPYVPEVKRDLGEAEAAIQSFRLADGYTCSLVAAEPMVANPVAFWIDAPGVFYVAETFRQDKKGVPDNRDHAYWLHDDLLAQRVEDRAAYYLKHHPEYAKDYTAHHDRITRLMDRDGDGRAEEATVFADGFNALLDGTGAGVLKRGQDVYYTCIPHLWKLTDLDGDGVAEARTALSSGYGVRTALRGHDSHGLVLGPDGRLYFSIGDRGYHVLTQEQRLLADPRSGAVFRCWPDGSELEVFATGLRNPQELAFDDFGNLFTVDNNSDSDDKARILYIVEGGETGWRMNFQTLSRRGPWVEEEWWKPDPTGNRAPFRIPPIENIGSGPSGLCFDPGTGVPESLRGAFLICDFLGGRTESGVRAFFLNPQGAGFAFNRQHHVIKGLLPTDVDFGPDGALYVLDWVEGWVGAGKGRIYRLSSEAAKGSFSAADTGALLALDVRSADIKTLIAQLAHADRRVRQKAQFELAERGEVAVPLLTEVARGSAVLLARLHALWALGQIGRVQQKAFDVAVELLRDPEIEVRALATRLAVQTKNAALRPQIAEQLRDAAPRVRFHAAYALAELGLDPASLDDITEAIAENADQDPYLRHALVMALASLGEQELAAMDFRFRTDAERLALVLALRRLRSPLIALFLDDPATSVSTEAARAIYDLPIPEALQDLAARISESSGRSVAYRRRCLHAADQLGTNEAAEALLSFAARDDVPQRHRTEAVQLLAEWSTPSSREKFTNEPRPVGFRREKLPPSAQALVPRLLSSSEESLRTAALGLARETEAKGEAAEILAIFEDRKTPTAVRLLALDTAARLSAPGVEQAVRRSLGDASPEIRAGSARTLAVMDPDGALPLIRKALEDGTAIERQVAAHSLGGMSDAGSEGLLVDLMKQLHAGTLPPEYALEVVKTARRRASEGSRVLTMAVADYDRRVDEGTPLAGYLIAEAGGDPVLGRKVFLEKTETVCTRCHLIDGTGDPAVNRAGPPLNGIGRLRDRRHFLTSLIEPNRDLTEGYQNETVELKEGGLQSGRVLNEDATTLILESLETGRAESVTLQKSDIADRRHDISSMPGDIKDKLSLDEIRNLIAFLESLR